MLDPTQPFILLDDAREGGGAPARLYTCAVEIVQARDVHDVAPALARVRRATRDGLHAAGWLAYEAGHALEPRLKPRLRKADPHDPPLLWFGLFERVERLEPAQVAALLPDPAGAATGPLTPRLSRTEYDRAIARVLDYVAAGDIYQVNLSFRADVPIAGHPLALYARMSASSRAGWGGVVFTGRHWLLSCSPELFFSLNGRDLLTRPMKGTAARAADPAADADAAARLLGDAKQRAENLMIVDLLRNDLSRVAVPGSVAVPRLFTLESYPTIHTMTSTITAELAPGRDAIDVLEAIFPCGSITGAPKIRAMEIVDELEADVRGPYTGSIGWIAPDGDAAFNVTIRTLVAGQGSGHAVIGLGSAVVADSTPEGEWRECLAKGAFVTTGARPFDLLETMRFDPIEGLPDLERHLMRMKTSAEALGFTFDRHATRNELQAATFRLRDPAKIRLRLSTSGAVAIEVRALPQAPAGPVAVAVMPLPVVTRDFRVRHKTSDRAFYDEARAASGAFEVLFTDEDGFLTEGSFTSIFVERDGLLVTPSLARGLMPGVLRQRLLDEGLAIEDDLTPADLAGGFHIGNALRGLIPAKLAAPQQAGL